MSTKPTYLPLEAADDLERFIVRRESVVGNAIKARTRNYNTLSILKLLYQLRGGSMTRAELYISSAFRLRSAFQNYLDFCLDCSFVRCEDGRKGACYAITEKGLSLLEIFIPKGN